MEHTTELLQLTFANQQQEGLFIYLFLIFFVLVSFIEFIPRSAQKFFIFLF